MGTESEAAGTQGGHWSQLSSDDAQTICFLAAHLLRAHVGCSKAFAKDDSMSIQRLLSHQPEFPSIILG